MNHHINHLLNTIKPSLPTLHNIFCETLSLLSYLLTLAVLNNQSLSHNCAFMSQTNPLLIALTGCT